MIAGYREEGEKANGTLTDLNEMEIELSVMKEKGEDIQGEGWKVMLVWEVVRRLRN